MNDSEKSLARRPTMRDVAARAGVHYTTVSLSLNGNKRIPEKTRDRIINIARELGYRKIKLNQALVSCRTNSRFNPERPAIVFFTNRKSKAEFEYSVHMRYFYEGAKRKIEAMGYRCDLFIQGNETHGMHELPDWLKERDCAGLILGALLPPCDPLPLDWDQFAVVKIDSRFTAPHCDIITNDQVNEVRLTFNQLTGRGYRRIGMAVSDIDDAVTNDLYHGSLLTEQAAFPRDNRIPLLRLENYSAMEKNAATLKEWINRYQVDAVMCNWTIGSDLLNMAGLEVPGDIAFAGLCLSDISPAVSGIIPNHVLVGEKAAEAVALKLKLNLKGIPQNPVATYVEGHWHEGNSAPPKKEVVCPEVKT